MGCRHCKNRRSLLREIEAGETVLIETADGLRRRVSLVRVEVLHQSGDATFKLVEEKQVFSDGRTRRRDLSGVNEKMLPNEEPITAAVRGLSEEIGVEANESLTYHGSDVSSIESPSYPGLRSEYITHNLSMLIDDASFRPEGYIEEQNGKSTYFGWTALAQ